MGANIGVIAAKTTNSADVVGVIDQYYSQLELVLSEVSIGEAKTQYTKETVKDISEFQKVYRPKKEGTDKEFSTEFDFYFNLDVNKDWAIITYDRKSAKKTLNIDESLAKKLSEELKTEVIEYYRYDTVNLLEIRRHASGKKEDELYVGEYRVLETAAGYFSQFPKKYKNFYQLQERIEFPYLKQLGLDLESEELGTYDTNSWRRFYLSGDEEKVQKYLAGFNPTFEGIKAAYNLMVGSIQAMRASNNNQKD